MRTTLRTQLDRLATDRWARDGMRTLLRSALLGLSLGCIGLGVSMLLGITLEFRWLAAAALTCLAGGAVLLLRPRLRAEQVARRLDRRFRLHEQLSTALELDAQSEGVAAQLNEQARLNLGRIRRHVAAQRRFPWVEIGMFLALLCLFLGLAIFSGVLPPPPFAAAEPLPPIARPELPNERFPDEPFQPPGTQAGGSEPGTALAPGPGDQAAIAAIADALRDQSVTRPAAEALDQGDAGGAAQRLREVADQAGQVSQEARADLADALRTAADRLEAERPDLAEQLRDSAAGLAAGADSSAATALEQLADTVDQLGQAGGATAGGGPDGQAGSMPQAGAQGQNPGGAGAGQSLPGEQREQPTQRLGVDGVPLELEGAGNGSTPTSGASDRPAAAVGEGSGFERGQGSLNDEAVAADDDPLRIPADLRDVVQDYFSP
jgi:hypothetical protein